MDRVPTKEELDRGFQLGEWEVLPARGVLRRGEQEERPEPKVFLVLLALAQGNGDLVTKEWFNDVWTKEVFANFVAAKIVNPSFPEIDHDLNFLARHYPAAYSVDHTPGANRILSVENQR